MSNMYEEIDDSFNPLGGECQHKCSYCYVNSWKKRSEACRKKYSGEIRLYENEFKKKLKGKIFVVSMNDLFAANVPEDFIIRIVEHCKKFEDNAEFLFQSKNVERMYDFYRCNYKLFPEKRTFCTTIENDSYINHDRANILSNFIMASRQLTIEPIMDFHLSSMVEIIRLAQPHIVAIGADSKNNKLKEPSKEKTLLLIAELEKFTKVVIKPNLQRIIK